MFLHKWKCVILLLALLFIVSSCGKNTTDQPIWWHLDDTGGYFATNDVERAKNEIPFPVLLPSYLPGDVISTPVVIQGPLKGTYPDGAEILIGVRYSRENGETAILMNVKNKTYTFYPNLTTFHTYLDIAGVQVIEQDIELSATISGVAYRWNWDGISYYVTVIGYSRYKAREVIKSMISE